MARVKRGTIAHKRRKHIFRYTKGFRWGRKSKYRYAKNALWHAWRHAWRDRKRKKRVFRALWQITINAALRENGLNYSRFIPLLKKQSVAIDRKILSSLAKEHRQIFDAIIEKVTSQTP
ncbi:MAG: 50S ribosomal protein L20 [Patescibacteria group bacterium]